MKKKRRIILLLLAMILAFAIAGCGAKADKNETSAKDNSTKVESSVDKKDDVDKNSEDKSEVEVSGDVAENETVTEKGETQKTETDNKKDDATTNTETNKNNTTANKNESTSNKNETTTKPSTGSTGSTNNSGNTGSTTNNNTNSGTITQPSTPVHEHKWTEVKETVVVQEAWTEEIKAWRTLCNVCKKDLTDMSSDDILVHVVSICGGSYANYYMTVNTVQHPAVTEEQVTGYKCECGATKNK